jgi:hypothetical protein
MQITPDALEHESLSAAATRLDFLARRDTGAAELNTVVAVDEDDWSPIAGGGTSLDVDESLELLALGEVVRRKAHDSRLTGIRAALRGGADWADIGAALGVAPAQAWDTFHELLGGAGDRSSARLAGPRPR